MSGLDSARVLVTGGSGFVGQHLVERLLLTDCELYVASRGSSRAVTNGARRQPTFVEVDLRRADETNDLIAEVTPTHIFHLAGVTGGDVPWQELYEGNVLSTFHLVGAVASSELKPWILIASSSAVYGRGRGELLNEESPVEPLTLYGVAKACQELVGLQHTLTRDGALVRARMFNLLGPGQPAHLIPAALARQVASIERGQQEILEVGNLAPQRDYLDVRDAVGALVLLGAHTSTGTYNICSGTARSVGECLERLAALASIPIPVKQVTSRYRDVDVPSQTGDPTKLRFTVPWDSQIAFDQSLADSLQDWRARVIRGSER